MTDWEIVDTVGTEQEALLIAGFLESRDVPVRIESLSFRQEPVTFGALAQVRLRVPPAYIAEAKRLLDARRHRFAIVDGEGRVAEDDESTLVIDEAGEMEENS